MCVFCLLISLLINVVLVHPSQYTLAPPIHNWFLLHCLFYCACNGSVCSTQIFQPNFQEWSIRGPTHFTLTSQEPPLISLHLKEPHLLLLSSNKAAFQRCSCDGRCNIAEMQWWIIIDYQTAWIKGTKFVLGKVSCGCKVSTCRYNFQ